MSTSTVGKVDPEYQIEDWRHYRGFTQRELAARSGLAVTTINEIETGKRKPRRSSLIRLASALGTEEWNLGNPPRSAYGAVGQIVESVRQLAAAADEFAVTVGSPEQAARGYLEVYTPEPEQSLEFLGQLGGVVTQSMLMFEELARTLRTQLPDDVLAQLAETRTRYQAEWKRAGIHVGGERFARGR